MTLIIQKPTGAKLVLAKGYPNDPDVLAYIAAVQAADESASPGIGALEIGTVKAIDDFVTGCKSDGIWLAIKASCILAGARTRLGALTPLVGTAPTSFNFVDGDYNRKTGLVGDGTSKHLDSTRANNADPQDSNHNAFYISNVGSGNGPLMTGGASSVAGDNYFDFGGGIHRFTNRHTGAQTGGAPSTGFKGTSRNAGASYTVRINSATITQATASQPPSASSVELLSRPSTPRVYSNARLAFYSIGESLDLALLDARVTDLINAFAAAIP
jgi:hypothetical protein